MRAVVLGGGGFRVPLMHSALVASGLPVDELALYDVSAERLDVMTAVLAGDGPRVSATTDLDRALDGADLVFAALRVGGLDGRVRDEREALDAGVVGQETVGAGGLASALRTVPVVDAVATRIAARAPDAWTITMTNPAGIVTEAMATTLGDRVIGVCDSPIALVRRACAAAGLDPGPSLASVTAAVDVDYAGLNHLGWLQALRADGVDRLPALLADDAALSCFEEGRLFGAPLIRAVGALPNEYLYWYYAAAEAHRAVRDARRTRAEHVRRRQQDFYAAATADPARARELWWTANDERNRSYLAELREGDRDEADVSVGGYESVALALASALTGGPTARLIVDVAHAGTAAGLPADAVVESVCDVDASGAHPRPLPTWSPHQSGLVAQVKDCERSIISAARTGSRTAALRAFALHPLVDSVIAAERLADAALVRRTPSGL